MASPSELADQIDKSVANNFQKQISLTQQLIGFKSQRGNEAAIQKFMRHEYNARGYDTVEFDMDEAALCEHPGAGKFSGQHSRCPIVVGTYKPGTDTPTPSAVTKGRSLMLNTHVDVVPTGPEAMWKYGPYEAVVEDDWLYGRGAADMLAGASAILFALDALRDAGLRPASPVTLVSVVEEESTGNGTLMVHLKGYRADAVFIPEPEEEMLVRANVGVLWFTVKVQGVPAHVREMATGSNAIEAMYKVIDALRKLEERWNEQKSSKGANFEKEDHPINLNIGKIEGGDWASSVPAWCQVDCRIAIYPGRTADDAAKEIERHVAECASADPFLQKSEPVVVWNGFFAEGFEMNVDNEAVECLAQAHERVTGKELQTFMTAGYLDARVHVLYDRVPTLCYGPVSQNIHAFDERVSLSSLKRVTATMAHFIARWCGVEKISGQT